MTGEKAKPTSDGINAKIDWNRSVFEQCQRIDMSQSPGEFRKNLDILWAKLSPYEDSQYESDKKEALNELRERANAFAIEGATTKDLNGLIWDDLVSRYAALMKLAFREKVLPQRVIPQKNIGSEKKEQDKKKPKKKKTKEIG